jgi:hypothetical protein
VVINEEHDKPEAVTGIAKAFTDFCGENSAGIFVMSYFLSTTGVVHQDGDVKSDGVFHVLEDLSKELLLGIFGMDESVEDINTAESVLIGRVAMKEFVLHKVGQLAKLWEVTTEESISVHPSEDMSDLTAVLEDLFECFSVRFVSPKVPVNEVPIQLKEASDLRTGAKVATLGVQKEAHEALWVLCKYIFVFRVNEATFFKKAVE